MELPRAFAIRHASHRILNPFDVPKLATLGRALGVHRDQHVLDLACGKGEMLCTWARDHDIVGTGVDINPPFVAAARARASELGVSDRVTILHDNATDWVSTEPVDIAACVGATWIGGGVPGTIELLRRSLRAADRIAASCPIPAGMAWLGSVRTHATTEPGAGGSDAHCRFERRTKPGFDGLVIQG